MSDREIEASALTKAALLLQACQQNWDAPDGVASLAEALEFNQKLWSIFQTSLADENHPMSRELRADILRLAGYIDKRIFEMMSYPEPEKLNIIIQINYNLAAGLRTGETSAETWRPLEVETSSFQEETLWA
jgi:flagellar protein FlaF